MLSSLELRFATTLREKIQEEMGEYIANLDSISGANDIIALRFVEARAQFTAFEDVLAMIDELQDEMSK